ncbi:MAG: hypothetical protein Q9M28_11765 [Mariprofundaceae bacterium]|nr:hypothetical protein [Mariprofundaceae bacterium]
MILLCSACSYHIVGQDRGVIPNEAHTVSLHATSANTQAMQAKLLAYFQERSHGYQWQQEDGQAQMQFLSFAEQFVPVAYDAAGIATSYRLSLSGSLELWHDEKEIWRSGSIAVYDDVFVLGGPASVDASRKAIREELERQWMIEVWLRIASGF